MTHAYANLRALGFEEAILWLLLGNERAERFYRADRWQLDSTPQQQSFWGVPTEVVRYKRTFAEKLS